MSSIIFFSWLDNGLSLKLALHVKVIYFADIYCRETLSFHDLLTIGRTLRLCDLTLIAQFCSPQGQTWILFVTHHLSSTIITSQSVQGIDDVYAISNKYRQLDQFHGHANSSHVSSLAYSHIFIIKYFVRYVYKIYSGGDIWCVCIALLYLDLRLLHYWLYPCTSGILFSNQLTD